MNKSIHVSLWTLLSFILITIGIVSIKNLHLNFDFRSRASFNSNTADVIVVGAGTGGIAAALQAARQGSTVILLEETDYIGGQMTAAGVTSIDGGDPRWTGGIYEEFRKKVVAYYQSKGKTVGTCYWGAQTTCFEPSVGQTILKQMIDAESNISLRLRSKVLSMNKSGNLITSMIVSTNGNSATLNSKIVIDATEYGDVIAQAGAAYRTGNGTNTQPNSNACVQDITYLSVMKRYPNGVPAELHFTAPPPGYTSDVISTFSKTVSNSGFSSGSGKYPVTWAFHNAYRGMPDSSNAVNYNGTQYDLISKTGVNWANDYPLNAYVNPLNSTVLSVKYLEDKAYRKQINCEAKLRTIQFMYYIQHDLGKSDWSVANDEGYDTPWNREENSCAIIPTELKPIEKQMPPIPYVRESRRGIGSITVTAKDIKRAGTPAKAVVSYPSSVAIGDYPNDLHNCTSDQYIETSLEAKSDTTGGGPFQLPIEALISVDVPNLLFAEKNLSMTRFVNGASRLQPITMTTGQAAGSLAALAANKNIAPKSVKVLEVQRKLLSAGAMLVPFTDVAFTTPKLPEIQQVALRGILSGTGQLIFGVNDMLNRNQAAAAITRAYQITIAKPAVATFTDVPISDMFYSSIESIYASGITAGCSANPKKYCPNDPTANGQFAVFVLRGWQKLDPTVTMVTPGTPTYSDVPTTYYAYSFIESLAAQGIKWYCDPVAKKFCPDSGITRSMAAYILSNILAKFEKLP